VTRAKMETVETVETEDDAEHTRRLAPTWRGGARGGRGAIRSGRAIRSCVAASPGEIWDVARALGTYRRRLPACNKRDDGARCRG